MRAWKCDAADVCDAESGMGEYGGSGPGGGDDPREDMLWLVMGMEMDFLGIS